MSESESEQAIEYRDDLLVAAAAGLSAVGLALALEYTLGVGDFYPRLAPLAVYFVYLFTAKGPAGRFERGEPWAALAVLVAVATYGYYALA